MNNLTVPFEITNINHGLQKAGGLLKWDGKRLMLEFKVEDAIIGLFSSDVREVSIPLSALQSIQFKKNIFTTRMILEGKSLAVFGEIPGTEQALCRMKIKRADRNKAARLASAVQLALSEYRLDQMQETED